MSVLETRGGVPHVWRASVTTTGQKHILPSVCKALVIRAATNPCRLFFTQADFDANENYVVVPIAAAATPHGEWTGPVEANAVWLKGDGGTSSVELVTFQRRG